MKRIKSTPLDWFIFILLFAIFLMFATHDPMNKEFPNTHEVAEDSLQ